MENERKIDISVIIVVYNQLHTLKLSLKSLLIQDFVGSYEIIICDDGSNSELFSQCRNDFNQAQIAIKYVWQQDRYFRAAAARNNGIKISQGKFLLFLDGDIIPALDTVKKHYKSHTKSKLLVAGNRKWRGKINDDLFAALAMKPIEKILQDLEYNWAIDEKSKERERKERQRRRNWLNSLHPWRACFSGNVSVQWSSEVYFDENFVGWGPEDWEFNYRLCEKYGHTPVYNDEITTYHIESVISKPFMTENQEDIVRYLKNTCYFYDRCPGLKLEEVFFWFPRFILNKRLDKWEVAPRVEAAFYNLKRIVEEVRNWLKKKGIYP